MRFRTHWNEPVTDPCITYDYGNCCDFTASFEYPVIQVTPTLFNFTIQQGGIMSDEMIISNTGEEDLSFQIEILDETRKTWDVQFAHEMAGLGPQNAIAWDGGYFYITGFTSPDIYIFDANGNFIGSVQLPGKLTIRDFTWDGYHLWACNGSTNIFQIDIKTPAIISSLSVPFSPRSIAYNHDQDAFWMGDWTTQLFLVDKSGAMLGSYALAEQVFGMDYDNFLEDEKYLWLLGYDAPGFRYFQFDITSGMNTGVEHYIGEDFGYEFTSSGLFVENDIIAGTTTIGGLIGSEPSQFFGYELYGGGGTDWLSVEPASGMILPGDSAIVMVMADGSGLEFGEYEKILLVQSNDPANPEIEVPVTLDVITTIGEQTVQNLVMFPNPTTNAVFIRSNEPIRQLKLVSLSGKIVINKKVNGNLIYLDISDLKPGIYLVEIETGMGFTVRKLVVE